MRTLMSLLVAFVVVSILNDTGAGTQRVVTGTVAAFQAGEWISVANEQTDPRFQIGFRDTTIYEGHEHGSVVDPAAIKPGVRVTIWYRSMWERRPVADKVRLLTDAATP